MHSLALAVGKEALVLKEFKFNPAGPNYVHILARKQGTGSWFRALIGLDSSTSWDLSADTIRIAESSVSGTITSCIPIRTMSYCMTAVLRPVKYFIFGVLFIILGVLLAGFACAGTEENLLFIILSAASTITAIVFIVLYLLRKSLSIGLMTCSGDFFSLPFKKSIIEGVAIDDQKALEIVELINHLIGAR